MNYGDALGICFFGMVIWAVVSVVLGGVCVMLFDADMDNGSTIFCTGFVSGVITMFLTAAMISAEKVGPAVPVLHHIIHK